ncbi:MBL fold metallo-hydrolase [Leisingera thetidis]|uniref:MBL fold metallo-hydrolase n=1 Tax=Leisingera thetidis TaxID=2930199 RepID=UPI0021F6E366|nr:MBL fold metallo-hydrolase [Leisingera thetidis]
MPNAPHTLSVGQISLTVFDDGHFDLPLEYFSGLSGDLSQRLSAPLTIGANLWQIDTASRRVLVDTGSGQALRQMFPATGQALEVVSGEAITDIVLTHMHADHLGGLLGGGFSGVRVHVSKPEWKFWTQAGLADAVPEEQRPMIEMVQAVAASFADRVVTHEGAADLGEGLTLVPLPGHTPGHTGLRLRSGGEELLIVGDAVISGQVHFSEPDAGYALDSDADAAAATRRALLADAAQSGTPIAATHLPFPGLGRVEAEGDAWRFVPL